MLSINLKRVFEVRGIRNPYSELVKLGISRPTAWNLLDNNTSTIRAAHMEKICELLNCEPNDIYEWRPDKSDKNDGNHPLKALLRDDKALSVAKLMHELPLSQLGKIEELLSSLNKKD